MEHNPITFETIFTQKGRGPHIDPFILTLDSSGDVFYSENELSDEGIKILDTKGKNKFAVSVRWNVEGYGYLYIQADNEGEFYDINAEVNRYNLSYELAKSRTARNRKRAESFKEDYFSPSNELKHFMEISNAYLDDASKHEGDKNKRTLLSQKSLQYALHASDMLEYEKAVHNTKKIGHRPDFLYGCDSRGYFQMDSGRFLDIFSGLFNYATITHYLIGDVINFEEKEGEKQFAERDKLLDKLLELGITVEGRPLFWVHSWVTPEWMKNKNFDQIKLYLEDHIKKVVRHYGDRIKIWEVVNEMHDWANEVELSPEQMTELTSFACEVARSEKSEIKLLINNCCPFAQYIQKRKWHEKDAKFPQRTPHQFTTDAVNAGADFDLIGVQVYFVHRTYADQMLSIERYEEFNKNLHLAEVGAPSHGITQEFTEDEKNFSGLPYEWTRHWDEELQADWLEKVFTFGYGKPYVEAANWYDFVDPMGFLKHGGIIRSKEGEAKAAVDRLLLLKEKFKKL